LRRADKIIVPGVEDLERPITPPLVRALRAAAARLSVVALEREGGQAQFIVHPPPPHDGVSLAPLLEWIEKNPQRDRSQHSPVAPP